MENSMVQMERLSEYAELTAEAPETIEDNQPEAMWPSSGAVEFKDYSTCYREGLDLVLKGLSFSVQPKQKVGIVGRTGAGKSLLTLALFRIIEGAGGDIIIEGQPISQYGVADVRNKLSIIPQDPVLFAGTVCENLDPFNRYSDQEIWVALEHAHLADFIRTKDDRLEFQITPGGENFSVGQRQLICLARALLKQAKILVLDEAMAVIDNATNSIIQESIRREFKNCTVLTIAHRVNTIIDSGMILVMDGGKAAEYDTPANLLQNKDSLFAKLVEESKTNNDK
ncbi:Canalicular multispecific organic anion transporter 1 [Coemansia sp. RSA 2610]|nr:Canalicular multispecific organic anion transporter 1 [Coemansia sp. RSA 2610]